MTQLEIFSKNLRDYLVLRKKTQADLSKYLSVSSATVSNWCSGIKMPRTTRIADIARWLNIEVTDLFDEAGVNENKLTVIADNELADFIDSYKLANPELRKAALAVLKSGVPSGETPPTPPDTAL